MPPEDKKCVNHHIRKSTEGVVSKEEGTQSIVKLGCGVTPCGCTEDRPADLSRPLPSTESEERDRGLAPGKGSGCFSTIFPSESKIRGRVQMKIRHGSFGCPITSVLDIGLSVHLSKVFFPGKGNPGN